MKKHKKVKTSRRPAIHTAEYAAMTDSQKAEYRRAQKKRRARRLPTRAHKILALREEGFHVEEVTAHHFLVNGRLDLYPVHNTYRDRLTGATGGHKNLAVFTREWRKQ